jgi:hypothetical protein
MLAFLDSFCQALSAHDPDRIRRQLRHPLARALPAAVRAEALAIARAGRGGRAAPVRAFRFYFQTLQLLATSETTDASPMFDPVAVEDFVLPAVAHSR